MKPVYDYWHWHDLRMRVLDRDGCCIYCGKELDKYTITLDHMIPKSKGGNDTMDNLVASCKECNTEKADMLPQEFLESKNE
jgi:5-methylcytosine-specific restriction endonuclease McrA